MTILTLYREKLYFYLKFFNYCKLIPFIFFFQFTHAQEDEKIKAYEELTIIGNHKTLKSDIEISREEINQITPHDLGHLLQHIAGIAIRDYGGLGGMKTLSMRGLGGEHTRLIVNGLPTSNAQNGQTDFGLIQLDNIENVRVSSHNSSDNLIPVSAQVMGNTIEISTFEQTFSPHTFSIKNSNTIGSFGQKESYVAIKKGNNARFLSSSAKYRTVDGDYPYRIKMGNEETEHIRQNNAFNEYFINIGGGIKHHSDSSSYKHILKLNAQLDGANKQLPGAVILYNDFADETLKTQNFRTGGNYTIYHSSFKSSLFLAYNRQYLNYHDPSYFNQQGFIDNHFTNTGLIAGLNAKYNWSQFSVEMGTDIEQNDLISNRNDLGTPSRIISNSMLGVAYQHSLFELKGVLFNQFFSDYNRTINHHQNYNRMNPQISLYTSEKISKYFQFFTWYKHTLRPPSFNELYYSQIGNIYLEPEETEQINAGATFNKRFRSTSLSFRSTIYYNKVDNKILALPTKNLFVWSVLNIGQVEVLGTDFQAMVNYTYSPTLSFTLNTTATYQRVYDVSNRESPTYRHQIAYTPQFTSSTIFSLHYKNLSSHTTAFHVGERYSLNQNIPSNLLEAFTLFDTSLAYHLTLKKQHQIELNVGVRNVFNQSYNFIRYFVMPGRNYFLKLTYEIN